MSYFILSCFVLMTCVTGTGDILNTVSFVQSSNGQTKDLYWEMDCVEEHSVSATVDSQQEYITFNTNQYPVNCLSKFCVVSVIAYCKFQLLLLFQHFSLLFFSRKFSVLGKKLLFFMSASCCLQIFNV